jgi:hypothetical protein
MDSLQFYQTWKEELIPVLLKLFHELEKKGALAYLFYKASITLTPNQTKTQQKRDLKANLLMNIDAKTSQ